MGIEKKIAELELLSEGISGRIKPEYNASEIQLRLKGIECEAKVMYEVYNSAVKAVKKMDFENANRYVSEFALAAKNMADNLNLFMQQMYGTNPIKLPNIKKNLQSAPKSKSGMALYDFFENVHDSKPESALIMIRNLKGHGKGHDVLNHPVAKRLYLKDADGSDGAEAGKWLNHQISSYLGMAVECLETISKDCNNAVYSRPGSAPGKVAVSYKRLKNYAQRYSEIAAAVILSIGLAGGIGGTVAYQNHAERMEAEHQRRVAQQVFMQNEGVIKTWDRIGPDILQMQTCGVAMKTIEDLEKLGLDYSLDKRHPLYEKYLQYKKGINPCTSIYARK
jgi:hypothetical protein